MKVDNDSPWRAELVDDKDKMSVYDAPRCALATWQTRKLPARSLRVREYYTRSIRDAADVVFVVGADVMGPMGPDLVPVEPAQAPKFMHDHGGKRALRLEEITSEVIATLGAP